MKNKILNLLPLLIILILSILIVIRFQTSNDLKNEELFLPELNLISISSNNNQIMQLNDKKFILNIFASWCESCHIVHQKLVTLNKNNSYKIFGIAVRDNPYIIEKLFAEIGNPYQDVAIDNDGVTAKRLKVRTIPETIFVENNVIIKRFPGGAPDIEIENFFKN